MKPNGNLRKGSPEETLRKAVKLAPMKKSGKEKQSFYRELDEEDDPLVPLRRESALDYYDDNEDVWDEVDEEDDGPDDDQSEAWPDEEEDEE